MNRGTLLGALAALAWGHGLASALLYRAGEPQLGWFLLVSAGVLAFLTVPAFASFIPSVEEAVMRGQIDRLEAKLTRLEAKAAPQRRQEKPS